MWFLFQQPEEFLERFHAERQRADNRASRLRALRSSTFAIEAPISPVAVKATAEQPCSGQLAAERS